jgi:hypothetical protein
MAQRLNQALKDRLLAQMDAALDPPTPHPRL